MRKMKADIQGVPPERFQEIIAFLKKQKEFRILCELVETSISMTVANGAIHMKLNNPERILAEMDSPEQITYIFIYKKEAIQVKSRDGQIYIRVEQRK